MTPDRPPGDEGILDAYFFGEKHVRFAAFADPRFRDPPTELVGVLPMGRSQTSHGFTLMLLCLEVYGNCAILQLRTVHGDAFWRFAPPSSVRRLWVDVADDRGTRYAMVSGAGGWSNRYEARVGYWLWPTIDPGVQEFIVTRAMVDFVDPATEVTHPERIAFDTSAWRFPFKLVGNNG